MYWNTGTPSAPITPIGGAKINSTILPNVPPLQGALRPDKWYLPMGTCNVRPSVVPLYSVLLTHQHFGHCSLPTQRILSEELRPPSIWPLIVYCLRPCHTTAPSIRAHASNSFPSRRLHLATGQMRWHWPARCVCVKSCHELPTPLEIAPEPSRPPGLWMRCQKNHHSFTNSYKTWREFVSIYKSYNHLWAPPCSGHWPPNPLRASNL